MPETAVPTPSEALRAAADLIEAEGWVKGAMYRPGCGFCAEGAIALQFGVLELDTERARRWGDYALAGRADVGNEAYDTHWVTRVAVEKSLSMFSPLTAWNDQVAESAEEVTSTLRAVAADIDAAQEAENG